MKIKQFLTNQRRENIFKLCLNFSSIMFASMIASEFFIKSTLIIRVFLSLLFAFLIITAIYIGSSKNTGG